MKIGVVGCGYVADFYALCLRANAPELELVAVYDPQDDRATSFSTAYGGRVHTSLDSLLRHPGLDMVLNLTPPGVHAEITELALRKDKHVYSEKPLATDLRCGRRLIELALSRGLGLGAAPAVHRSPAARKMRRVIGSRRVGRVSHLYCDLDDGPLHRMNPQTWHCPRGLPWPIESEFQAPLIHHAPYAATWALLFGGSATAIRGFTAVTTKVKCGVPAGPDLCLAVMEHESGCLTRLTIGALAKRWRRLVVVTQETELQLPDIWSVDGPVWEGDRQILAPADSWPYKSTHRLNFDQGPRDLASCLRRDSSRGGQLFTLTYGLLSLHVLEITLALSRPGSFNIQLTTNLSISRSQHT